LPFVRSQGTEFLVGSEGLSPVIRGVAHQAPHKPGDVHRDVILPHGSEIHDSGHLVTLK